MSRFLRNPALLGVLGVLLAALLTGLSADGPDQQLYIPYLQHYAHPSLYPGDYIFASDNYRATAFVPVFGTLLRWSRLSTTRFMLLGEYAVLWLWFTGLASVLVRIADEQAALWAVVFCSWALPIPGCAANLWEPALHPRTVAAAITWVALASVVRRRFVAGGIAGALVCSFHPLLGVGTVAGLGLASTAYGRRAMAEVALSVALPLIVIRLLWRAQTPHLPFTPVQWWLDIAPVSSSYLWFQSWPASIKLSFGFWIALTVSAWSGLAKTATNELRALFRFGLAALPLMGIALVGMQMRSPLLVALQVHRSFFIFEYAAIALTATYLSRCLGDRSLSPIAFYASALAPAAHSLHLVAPATIAVTLAPRLSGRWSKPAQLALSLAVCVVVVGLHVRHRRQKLPANPAAADWSALQSWARDTTAVETRFIAPLDEVPGTEPLSDFREYSERSVVLGRHDAPPTIFNHDLAIAVAARSPIYTAYANRDCDALLQLAHQFSAQFVVTEWSCPLAQHANRSGRYSVYAVP